MENIVLPFGETVLAWRVFREMTQAELAEKAGVPRSNLSDMERGRREVTLGTLRSLAMALDVRPGVLADGEGPWRGMPLSREALERIAGAAVRKERLPNDRERALARHLAVLLVPQLDLGGPRRVLARSSDRAWLTLRALLSKEVIDSVVRRALEKMGEKKP